MSSNSVNRDTYFEKHIKNTPDVPSYLRALKNSPYKTHRKVYIGLQDWVAKQTKERISDDKTDAR